MDEKDRQIIEILMNDSSLTTRQIAKKTLIPITTVHNRIRKLKKEGLIKKFTLKLNYHLIDKGFCALILAKCDFSELRKLKKDQHKLSRELLSLPEVDSVDIVTGVTDLLIRVRVRDVQSFDTFLSKKLQVISGIASTQSLVVIHEE